MTEQEAFEKHMLKTYGERWQEIGYPPNEILGVWQACAELKDKIIEQQAAELAALQDEIAYLRYFGNESCTAKADEAIKRGTWRIHETGQPTALLTGNETADGKASA